MVVNEVWTNGGAEAGQSANSVREVCLRAGAGGGGAEPVHPTHRKERGRLPGGRTTAQGDLKTGLSSGVCEPGGLQEWGSPWSPRGREVQGGCPCAVGAARCSWSLGAAGNLGWPGLPPVGHVASLAAPPRSPRAVGGAEGWPGHRVTQGEGGARTGVGEGWDRGSAASAEGQPGRARVQESQAWVP